MDTLYPEGPEAKEIRMQYDPVKAREENRARLLKEARWTHPQYYAGSSPVGDYVVASQHRDSGCLERSNWRTILAHLEKVAGPFPGPATQPENGPEDDRYFGDLDRDAWVYVMGASHCMVGWCETLLVRNDAPAEIVAEVARVLDKLDGYPVYSDDDYSTLEYEEICEYWEGLSRKEKAQLCREAGVPIRRGRGMPSEVLDRLRDTWNN